MEKSKTKSWANLGKNRFQTFDTALGLCGIVWRDEGICHMQLPEKNSKALLAKLQSLAEQGTSGKEPAFVRRAIKKVKAYLDGQPQDFSGTPLDLSQVPPFHRKVYQALQQVPPGNVTTYGELAEMAGSPLAFRAVGQAMARNPLPILVPCHRVLASAGKLGGFSSFGGLATKIRLLDLESGEKQ
jgi:methylated-DNA-[protein]-cysteine S-methyltransferase